MNSYAKQISLTISPLAVEAAVAPATHAHKCREWNSTPFTRERVLRLYGEQAAMAWDDLQASARSFYRAVESKEQG